MDIKQFYDVNKRTQTEQVLKNQEDIDALKDKDTDIDQAIEDEANARVQADEGLAYDIADLQHQIDSFGNVFTLKGSVATYGDLPATDNHIGDVWYVEADAVGYVWIDDNGTERWEQLGLPIDLSDYITTSDLALALEDYQEKLTAGTGISIINNVISASGKKYYLHNIKLYPTSYIRTCCSIITSLDVPFTRTTLAKWLYDNGYRNGVSNAYPVSLIENTPNKKSMPNGLYSIDGTTLSISHSVFAINNNDIEITLYSHTNYVSQDNQFTDTITEL